MLQPGFYISLSASPRSDRFLLDLSLLAARVQLCQLCRHVTVGPAELWIPALFPPARCWRPAGLRPRCFPPSLVSSSERVGGASLPSLLVSPPLLCSPVRSFAESHPVVLRGGLLCDIPSLH